MTSAVFKVVVAGLAVQTSAQMMLGQPAQVSVSSMSAMGADGVMHTTVHKVISQSSNDGMQKRIEEVDCKDGDCSKSVSHLIASSFAPSRLFSNMPQIPKRFPVFPMPVTMPSMPMPSMQERMPMVVGCMHKMHNHMHHIIVRMHNAMGPSNSGHFLGPRLVIMSDAPPPPAMSPTLVQQVSSGPEVSPEFKAATFMAGFSLAAGVLFMVSRIFRYCFLKAAARERPFRELGAPLAPEDQAEQAELGAGTYQPRVQATVLESCKTPEVPPTQAYLFNLYERAAHNNEKKVAQALLRDVYASALARVQ